MAYAYVIGMLGAMALLAAFHPRAALLFSIIILPWSGLDVDVGLRLTSYQLVLLPLALVTLVRLAQPGLTPPPLAAGTIFGALILYAMIWSLLQMAFLPDLQAGDSAARSGPVRAAIQIPLFLFSVSAVVITPLIIDRRSDILLMGRLYVASAVALCIIGWAQLVVWYATGSNPIPVEAFSLALGLDVANISGAFGVGALNIYRMNSFAGEPRELGYSIIFAMLMLQAHALTAPRFAGRQLALVWLFLFLSLFVTFSTSAQALWLLATATLLPACWLFGIKVERSARALVGVALLFIIPLLLFVAALEAAGIPAIAILSERTIARVGSDGAIEDFDLAIWSYFAANPAAAVTGVGLGNIHLYATPYLDPLFALYGEGAVFIGKTTYSRFISEIGIIGFGLLLGWYGWLAIQTRRAMATLARRQLPDSQFGAVIPTAGAVMVVAFGTSLVNGQIYAMGGAMAALCAMAWRESGMHRRAAAMPSLPRPA